jgi:hypothetical protein
MKNKESVSTKKQAITVKDLKTRKNPKGGACCDGKHITTAVLRSALPQNNDQFLK